MMFYLLPATLVFGLTSNALFRDDSTPNDDAVSWLCIAAATTLWPITLPCIIRKKVVDLYTKVEGSTLLLADTFETDSFKVLNE